MIKVSASLCAAALLVPALMSHSLEGGWGRTSHHRPGHSGRATEVLDVNYESGTPDSGIPGLTTTHATAPDASSVVRPGDRSRYAAQFKVTLGDPGYVSDGAPRSEDATDQLSNGTFHPGDTQRYEISILLKDWQPYRTGDSDTGDIIFQGKYGGAQPPAFYLMTKRNAIAFRSPHLNLQTTVVPDFRPYVDEWLNFRVDAHWTTGPATSRSPSSCRAARLPADGLVAERRQLGPREHRRRRLPQVGALPALGVARGRRRAHTDRPGRQHPHLRPVLT